MSLLKKHPWILILLIGSLIWLPGLGSFGLWDPVEIKQADLAQEVAKTGSWHDVTIDGRYSPRPPLYIWAVALGFKVLGVNEMAGRLPLALMGLLTLLLAYRVGRRLISREAGMGAALVLGTTPAFIFQARQLESDMLLYASILASVGGLAAYIWPASGKRCRWDLLIGAAGLVAGFLSRSLIIGVAFPLLTLWLAVALSWRTSRPADPVLEPAKPEPEPESEPESEDSPTADPPYRTTAEEEEPPAPARLTVGRSLQQCIVPLLGALAVAGVIIGALLLALGNTRYMLLGGEWRRMLAPPTFETTLRDIGWGFFPWIGLVPLALARFVLDQREDPDKRSSEAFPKLLVLLLVVGGYVLASFWQGYLGNLRYPALPWLAFGVGVLGAELMRRKEDVSRFWALAAVGLALVVHQDFFVKPDGLVFSHLLDTNKYPSELDLKYQVRAIGVLFAVLYFFSLGGIPRSLGKLSGTKWYGRAAAWVGRKVDLIGAGLRFLLGPVSGQRMRWGVIGAAIIFSGYCTYYLTPQLSLHLSNKALFGTFHNCKSGVESLAQYQVPGRGAAYYNDGQVEDVGGQDKLFELLRQDKRWFVLVPSHQLAPIDKAARQQNLAYYVLDDRSSQFLIISNKLEGKCNVDHNPLRRLVLDKPPKVKHPIKVNFDNKVELLGYEVDDVVTRGGKFELKLFFKVLGEMPSGYKIFIHFDQPSSRFHGDHVPLGGKFPTEYWMPGDYIVDPHKVDIPLLTTSSGLYKMYMGFWLGENRIKVIEGPNDGSNRSPIGTLRVR